MRGLRYNHQQGPIRFICNDYRSQTDKRQAAKRTYLSLGKTNALNGKYTNSTQAITIGPLLANGDHMQTNEAFVYFPDPLQRGSAACGKTVIRSSVAP